MSTHTMKTAIGRLRLFGITEGISFLVLLFIAMPQPCGGGCDYRDAAWLAVCHLSNWHSQRVFRQAIIFLSFFFGSPRCFCTLFLAHFYWIASFVNRRICDRCLNGLGSLETRNWGARLFLMLRGLSVKFF